MERKKNATFGGVARFCMMTTGLERTTFSKWDDTFSRAEVKEDQRDCPFAVIDFKRISGASRHGAKGEPFYNPFMAKFMDYKSLAMGEPHIWLCIVEKKNLTVVTELYKNMIKFEYNIFHITYVPTKTEGIVAITKARDNKQWQQSASFS